MKEKLREYINTIFADAERRAPHSKRVAELKEEMLQNLFEKYDDLIAAGKTPAAAYNIAVAGVGDISDLLDDVCRAESGPASGTGSAGSDNGARGQKNRNIYAPASPLTPEEQEIMRRYRERSAVITAISVAMYILCWIPLVIFSMFMGDWGAIVGLTVMFVMIAAATGMQIYNGMTKPKFRKTAGQDDDDDSDDDSDADDDHGGNHVGADGRPRRSPVYKAISGALWMLTVCGYLIISFLTGRWEITWMIFLIAVALDNIIKAIFDLRR